MSDPLSRQSAELPPPESRTPAYFQGFFAAEKRKPVVNHEPSWIGQAFTGAICAMPLWAMYYFMHRGATPAAGGANKGFMGNMMNSFKNVMDPTGQKNFRVTVKGTKFKSVVGIPEAKEEVQQYVEFLKAPGKFTRLGGRLPRGCLLTGKPGTGKTMLVKAVAGEADVPFFSCSGADFIEVYVGSGPKRVRELFEEAKAAAPSVVFMDEVDAIGSRGGQGGGGGGISGEENRTINQLLAELDGLKQSDHVIVFAATNFQENIDKALLREGRFDRKVELPMPDIKAREEIFKHYLDGVITGDAKGRLFIAPPPPPPTADGAPAQGPPPVQDATVVTPDPNVSNEKMAAVLAGLTPGMSPATISTVVNEAALACAIEGEKTVTLERLKAAIDDVLVGKKHRSRMNADAAARVALHECGHALVAWSLPQQTKVIKISITPRGRAAGFTQQLGREDLDMKTDSILFTDLCVLLGGRCAELTESSDLSTGAQDDLQRATKIAVNEFLAFGMSHSVGLLAFESQRLDEGRMYQKCSNEIQVQAELEAARLVEAAFQFTKQLLAAKKTALNSLRDELISKTELMEGDVEKVLGPRADYGFLDAAAMKALQQFTEASERVAQQRHKEFMADAQQGGAHVAGGTVNHALA